MAHDQVNDRDLGKIFCLWPLLSRDPYRSMDGMARIFRARLCTTEAVWLGLVVIAATGFVWLLGELASVAVLTQFAAIGLVVATVLTVFGGPGRANWLSLWASCFSRCRSERDCCRS